MFDNAKSGVQHIVPFQTNFKMFKHLSISVGGQYTETWTGKTIRNNDFVEGAGVIKDTISASVITNGITKINFPIIFNLKKMRIPVILLY